MLLICSSFVFLTAFKNVVFTPTLLPKLINALISFGRHDPPYPGPACKNFGPILNDLSLDSINQVKETDFINRVNPVYRSLNLFH